MESQELNNYQQKANAMLASGSFDTAAYDEIENFILKNSSRLSSKPDFEVLRETLIEVARKFGKKDLASLQEGFGLNSCAQ